MFDRRRDAPINKVVVVSTVFPYPASTGKQMVLSGILKYLFERYGTEHVTYMLLGSSEEDGPLRGQMPCRLLTLKGPSILTRLRNVFWSSLLHKTKSIQESMLYSDGLGRELRAIIAELEPDLIICDTFRTGQFFETAKRCTGRYVLYMDDLFSVRYMRMLEVLTRFPQARLNPLGNFAQFVPPFLRSYVRITSVQKWLLRFEQRLVEKRERECIRWFDRAVLINEEEASLLHRRTGQTSIQSIKPLLTNSGEMRARHYDGKPVFVFLGGLNLPHNQFSIIQFIETQADRMIEQIPGVKLRVIGRGASPELIHLAHRYTDNITLDGFVDDLGTVFSEACAMVVPLLFGSGVKIKTLEALSQGLPVISTEFGIEGIPITRGMHCIVENDIDRFPKAMSDLLDVKYNLNMSRQAREFCFNEYAKERIFRQYEPAFGGVRENWPSSVESASRNMSQRLS